MRYAQIRFTDDEEFFNLKLAAVKAKVSLETFIKEAISEKLKTIADEQLTADCISQTAQLEREK